MNTRKAMFSDTWYPGNAVDCEREITSFLEEGKAWQVPQRSYLGGIVPHAGWVYSGAIACNVIQKLVDPDPADVMLIFGMHLPKGAPNYIMTDGAWETPFGALPIHSDLADALTGAFPFKIETPDKFTQDNTIELQLPFVKYFFKDIAIVPMGVPPKTSSIDIGKKAVALAGELGVKVKVLGSTDLTHYGANYGFIPKGIGAAAVDWVKNENDRLVIDAMRQMVPEKVLDAAYQHLNACCAGAAATAIAAAVALGAESAEMVTYATSYDKTPGDNLVGYVGMVF